MSEFAHVLATHVLVYAISKCNVKCFIVYIIEETIRNLFGKHSVELNRKVNHTNEVQAELPIRETGHVGKGMQLFIFVINIFIQFLIKAVAGHH